jgi:hypothetical protein
VSHPTLRGHNMWNITSNNVQRAKERLQQRRAEIEARFTEENEALDAEVSVIETLEHAASEFMLRHRGEDGASAPTDPPGGNEGDSAWASVEDESPPALVEAPSGVEFGGSLEGQASQPAAEIDSSGGEIKGGLDFLKPGSRWRLYRGNQPTDPEGSASEAPLIIG